MRRDIAGIQLEETAQIGRYEGQGNVKKAKDMFEQAMTLSEEPWLKKRVNQKLAELERRNE